MSLEPKCQRCDWAKDCDDADEDVVFADRLRTPRKINGTDFDGSKDITTAKWGQARTITIQDADGENSGDAVSVNGSKNVTLKLPARIKNSDFINVKDFGAKGDGVTDDTAAILAAIEAADENGGQFAVLAPGEYRVSMGSHLAARLSGPGTLIYDTGKRISPENPATVAALEQRYFGEMSHPNNKTPQSIGVYKSKLSGKSYLFMTTVSAAYDSPSSNWTPGRGVFLSRYEINPDAPLDTSSVSLAPTADENCDIAPVNCWNIVGLGHGGGCDPAYVNGRLHVFCSVMSGDGYSDITMTADETGIETIRHIRGIDNRMSQVAVTPDGAKIIFCSNVAESSKFTGTKFRARYYVISVYDRAAIEAALEATAVSFTVGATALNSETPYLFTGNINPATAATGATVSFVSGTTFAFSGVRALVKFTVPASDSEGGVSGLCSDGTHIYFLASSVNSAYVLSHVLVYTFEGLLVRDIRSDFLAAALGERYLGGSLARYDYHPISTEVEGIACWDDQLLAAIKINCRSPEVYVAYRGGTYFLNLGYEAGSYATVTDEDTGLEYVICIDENGIERCLAANGLAYDLDFSPLDDLSISGTDVLDEEGAIVASFMSASAVTGVTPEQAPWVQTHAPTDHTPSAFDITASYQATAAHAGLYSTTGHKYLLGIGCRRNGEHAFPLRTDSFTQEKADYAKAGEAVLASKDGNHVWIGTLFARTQTFLPFLQLFPNGKLVLRDILSNLALSRGAEPEYSFLAMLDYDGAKNTLRLGVGNNFAKGAQLLLAGNRGSNVESDGSFDLQAAVSASRTAALHGTPQGALTWDNKDVHCAGDAYNKTFIFGLNAKLDANDRPFLLYGGTNTNTPSLRLNGPSYSTNPGLVAIRAYNSSGDKKLEMHPDGTLTWDGDAIQTASDERLKTGVGEIPDDVLDAWGAVHWTQYQMAASFAEKGEAARLHCGVIAQQIQRAFAEHGMDACAYGILCHDVWQDEYAEEWEEHEDGPRTLKSRALVRKAGEIWMVRYAEALAMEAAYQRRRADRLEARLAALETRIAMIEAEA